jgi:hypothetical protein
MHRYWFKRKTYGWGWQPATWQGWVSLLVFIALEAGNWFVRYEPREASLTDRDILQFVAESWVLVILLIFLCIRTGETPRWQWGRRTEDDDI